MRNKTKVWIVFSWIDKDRPDVEGIFTKQLKADAVAIIKDRPITVCPCTLDEVLQDMTNWPGSYCVYPDGTKGVE